GERTHLACRVSDTLGTLEACAPRDDLRVLLVSAVRAKGSRKNKLAFWRERRAGRCKAPRRRRCGDIVEERQRRRYAPWPPRPAGLRLPRPANYCGLPVMIQLGMGAAAKCQIILARALRRKGSASQFFSALP